MKKLILILLTTIPFIALSQKQDSIAFIGAKKVIIKNEVNAKENYTSAGNALINLNYTIGTKDAEFNQISSAPLNIEGNSYYRSLIFEFIAKDGQITITPKTKSLGNLMGNLAPKAVYDFLPYAKSKLAKDVYDRLVLIAKSLGGKLVYSE